MRHPYNKPFNLFEENRPLPSTIIQERIQEGVQVYSMGQGTSMSPEKFQFYKMLYVKQGRLRITIKSEKQLPIVREIDGNDCIITPQNKVICVDALEDSVYLEVMLGQTLKKCNKLPGEILKISKLGAFEEKKINVFDIVISGFVHMKVVCVDKSVKEDEIKLDVATMLSVYRGKGVITVDGVRHEVEVNDSMRLMAGSNVKVETVDGDLKLGVTNFFV